MDDERWRALEDRVSDAEARIVALQLALIPLARTFLGRVRWLFTGR